MTLPVEDGLTAAEYVELAQLAERSGYHARSPPGKGGYCPLSDAGWD